MNKHEDTKLPTLILVRGLPGSGKSYLAAALQKSLQKSLGQNAVVMLDPDATDYESQAYLDHVKRQSAEGVDPKLHPYRFLRAKAYAGIESRRIIVWNQAFTNLEIFNKMIDRLQTHAAEHGARLPMLVVEVEIDPVAAKERVAKRKRAGGHGVSDSTFARFTGDYKSFAGQGFNVVSVRGEDDVAVAVAAVLKALQDLWQKT